MQCLQLIHQGLRTFSLIVSAHPYCASKFTCHIMHHALAIEQMAISIAFGRSISPVCFCLRWPIFLLMHHFLNRYSTSIVKMKTYIDWKFEVLVKCTTGLRVKLYDLTLVTFGIIYVTEPLPQNMIKIAFLRWSFFTFIAFLRWLTFDILTINYPWRPRLIFKTRVVFHTLYLWNEVGDSQFSFAFLTLII